MDSSTIQILLAMVIYMAIVVAIGLIYAKRANTNSEEYFFKIFEIFDIVSFQA